MNWHCLAYICIETSDRNFPLSVTLSSKNSAAENKKTTTFRRWSGGTNAEAPFEPKNSAAERKKPTAFTQFITHNKISDMAFKITIINTNMF